MGDNKARLVPIEVPNSKSKCGSCQNQIFNCPTKVTVLTFFG